MLCCVLLSLCFALAAMCARAHAEDGVRPRAPAQTSVLLLEAPGLRPELCAALRIQLADVATVRCAASDDTPDLATRIASAAGTLERDSADLAVLLERDPSPARVRMVLVGRQPDQAVLAIETIEDRPAPDVDRSLALKVRDTLETMSWASTDEPPPMSLARTLAVQTEPHRAASPLHMLFEAGAGARLAGSSRATGQLALGARATRGNRYGELVLHGQLASPVRAHDRARGRVVEDEWALGLALRGGRSLGRIALGLSGELALVRASALGSTSDGRSRGERSLAFARLGLAVDLRVLLIQGPAGLTLRFAPTLQVDPVALRFELDGQSVLAPGRVHVLLPLSLLVVLPLRGAGSSS